MAKKASTPRKSKAVQQEREVIYPTLEVVICDSEHDGPITVEQAKKLLGWETEAEYTARRMAEDPEKNKGKEESFKYGDEYLLKDQEGQKVRCWNNDLNRPFEETQALTYAQDLLNKRWAGPLTLPGETINGESIIIGRTGQVESGQHRLIGLVLAGQIWAGVNKKKWQDNWPTEPVLESLVVQGVSEHAKVIMTLDNVKPRSEADVFYTSEYFTKLNPTDKRECSRMLAKANDFLWTRTGAMGYQTHSESIALVDRHKTLLDCIEHIFGENKERAITALGLSAGQCAGMMYLMGSSSSDGDQYRTMDPRTEKKLDWDNWDKALTFWADLVKGSEQHPIKAALNALESDDTTGGSRNAEKTAILAKAWVAYLENDKITAKDLKLRYAPDKNGVLKLDEWPEFGGIDIGPAKPNPEKVKTPDPTPEEIASQKEEERKRRAEELDAKLKAMRQEKKEASQTVAEPGSGDGKTPGKPPAPKILPKPANKKEVHKEEDKTEEHAPAESPKEEETPAPTKPLALPKPKAVKLGNKAATPS